MFFLCLRSCLHRIFDRMETDCCPVCWLEFSNINTPMLLSCGHTLCCHCITSMKQCPICKKRLPVGLVPVKNYALAACLEKFAERKKKDNKEFGSQTETEASEPAKQETSSSSDRTERDSSEETKTPQRGSATIRTRLQLEVLNSAKRGYHGFKIVFR